MAGLIDDYGGRLPTEPDSRGRPDDVYGALVRTIAGQQLSVLAARAIWRRLTEHFDGRVPTPREILDEDPDALRTAAGFSRAKVAYLRSLAEHVLDGQLELDRLAELSDAEVIAELTAVGDLGVRNAVMSAYGLDAPPKPAELEAIAEPWRPHRTRACLYLWRSLENTPD
jgi:DNA-3-methyladenine glycosylase II